MMQSAMAGVTVPRVALDIFSAENCSLMDETVAEVFGMMLGLEIRLEDAASEEMVRQQQTAIVGFAGAISGNCEISLSASGAVAVASAMLGGAEVEADSSSVSDAVGELCNMVAGGWKNRVDGLGSECSLSVPTVIAGTAYQVHRSVGAKINRRSYRFGTDEWLMMTLVYDPR